MANTNQGSKLIDAITTDHREVEQIFSQLEGGKGTPEERRKLADRAIIELVRHSVAEEQYVYPAARRALPEGDAIVDEELSEHAEAEKVMKALDGLDSKDSRFDPLLGQLMKDIRHHVEEEESDMLPKLVSACTAQQLDELAEKFETAKKVAPTRPHPAAPDQPPGNLLLDPGAGLIDRVRDLLTGRGR